MCTAIHLLRKQGSYFGRNLDLEYCYHEQVTVTPRNYPVPLRNGRTMQQHYAMIGMATIVDGYPLYYDATNEFGLSIAGLHFPENAAYLPKAADQDNIAPFELILWLLGECKTASQAWQKLQHMNLWNQPFSEHLPLSPLHWLVADDHTSFVIEPMADGLHLYENPFGILTNNPPFPYHLYNLANFQHLSPKQAENRFCKKTMQCFSNGMGAIGLPGDFSSPSRFVRTVFVKENSVFESDDVSQFFHILSSVAMPRGSIQMPDGRLEITQYSSCCDTKRGIYYYTTYENQRITAIRMNDLPLDANQLSSFPLRKTPDILYEN